MPLFNFDGESHVAYLGNVREVDNRKILLHVKNNSDLRKARVGQLACVKAPTPVDTWLIGIIERVMKTVSASIPIYDEEDEGDDADTVEQESNSARIVLVGTASWKAVDERYVFSRSMHQVPDIDANCYVLIDKSLENFMGLLVDNRDKEKSLLLGSYMISDNSKAYLDGDKLFQRHAALLGSTGSGKSWTVATILEKAVQLPSANLVVFDLHGEYSNLSYARQLKIPGPEELRVDKPELLFLPYWLLNAEEMQSLFVDRSEFSAHNQVMAFQDAVINEKEQTLKDIVHQSENDTNFHKFAEKALNSITLDSPVPFDIKKVYSRLDELNNEMEQGARGLKQGKFYGQFSRLITRIRSKLSDRRNGFLFQAPPSSNEYGYMHELVSKLLDFSSPGTRIKIIDFSEVPSEILPVIVGLVGRLVYNVQFWTEVEHRKPLALVCDEAHLYIPRATDKNPVERRAIEAFEKIAKEGRKYGVAIFIVSQRPSDVSDTVLSQCNNIISLRLTNNADQSTVKKLMPENMEGLMDVLPIMDVGEALVVGDAVLLPSRIKINQPEEKPHSATFNFWSEWMKVQEKPDFVRSVENMRRQSRNT